MSEVNVGIIGAGRCDSDRIRNIAVEVGELLAEKEALMICGGKGGVMAAASRGVENAGGISLGILPERDRSGGNEHLSYGLATGLGQGRNLLIVLNSDILIAIGGGYGTLSEIALAQKHEKPVILVHTWPLEEIDYDFDRSLLYRAHNAEQAVEKAFNLLE